MVTKFEARIKAGTPFTPIPKKRTKQQEEEAKVEGQAFIKKRETLEQGLGRQGARQQLTREAEAKPEFLAQKQLEVQALQAQRDLELLQATPRTKRGELPPEQVTKKNFVEGIKKEIAPTAVGVGAGALTGAVAGAAGGALVGGVGAIPGAIGGAVVGATGGLITKISTEKRQNVKEAFRNYTTARLNMNVILAGARSGDIPPEIAVELWDVELQNIRTAKRLLKQETHNELKKFLSGGMDELIEIESFERRLPLLNSYLDIAINNPNRTLTQGGFEQQLPEEEINTGSLQQ